MTKTKTTSVAMLLRLVEPLSHNDPARTDDSNTRLFNRQKQAVEPVGGKYWPLQEELDKWINAVTADNPVPEVMESLFDELPFNDFVAAAILKRFIGAFGRGDGSGAFTGVERYRRLEERAAQSATMAQDLRSFWSTLCRELSVKPDAGTGDVGTLHLLALPSSVGEAVLASLRDNAPVVTSLAVAWHQCKDVAVTTCKFLSPPSKPESLLTFIELPAFQANGIRNRMVRNTGWLHMVDVLDIPYGWPGQQELPPAVQAIFENGGNLEKGKQRISGSFEHSWKIRETIPLLDLVGGCTDTFTLGASRLKPSIWLCCKENYDTISEMVPAADGLASLSTPACKMLDMVTETHVASSLGSGQMMQSVEALVGAEFVVRFVLDALTPDLTKGALYAALKFFAENDPKIGGKSASGFGACVCEWLVQDENMEELIANYETYLLENKEQLLEELKSGRLGASVQVCS